MTISDQLQFSVLTAPIATVDRRSLSQAWYSALYGSGGTCSQNAPATTHYAQPGAHPPSRQPSAAAAESVRANTTLAAAKSQTALRVHGDLHERRAPRSPLARKIEHALLRPRTTGKSAFTVQAPQGRVHILLQTQGANVKIIAICPPKARAGVAAALAQARYTLACRGIALDVQTKESGV